MTRRSKYLKIRAGDIYKTLPVYEVLYKTSTKTYWGRFKCICNKEFYRAFNSIERGSRYCDTCNKYNVAKSKEKFIIKDRRLYRIWKAMNHRCHNPTDPNYVDYGGRGISVCEEWRDTSSEGFNNFYKDVGMYPTTKHSIDRGDVNLGYTKGNITWVTQKQQMNNVRNNHMLPWKGQEYTLQQIGELLGIKPNTILTRLRRGYPLSQAVLQNPTYKNKPILKPREPSKYRGKVCLEDFEIIRTLLLEGNTIKEVSKITKYTVDQISYLNRSKLQVDLKLAKR